MAVKLKIEKRGDEIKKINSVRGVMVSVIASSEICSWFEPQSGKAKDQAHSYMLLLR
jgi:hypothetical protein